MSDLSKALIAVTEGLKSYVDGKVAAQETTIAELKAQLAAAKENNSDLSLVKSLIEESKVPAFEFTDEIQKRIVDEVLDIAELDLVKAKAAEAITSLTEELTKAIQEEQQFSKDMLESAVKSAEERVDVAIEDATARLDVTIAKAQEATASLDTTLAAIEVEQADVAKALQERIEDEIEVAVEDAEARVDVAIEAVKSATVGLVDTVDAKLAEVDALKQDQEKALALVVDIIETKVSEVSEASTKAVEIAEEAVVSLKQEVVAALGDAVKSVDAEVSEVIAKVETKSVEVDAKVADAVDATVKAVEEVRGSVATEIEQAKAALEAEVAAAKAAFDKRLEELLSSADSRVKALEDGSKTFVEDTSKSIDEVIEGVKQQSKALEEVVEAHRESVDKFASALTNVQASLVKEYDASVINKAGSYIHADGDLYITVDDTDAVPGTSNKYVRIHHSPIHYKGHDENQAYLKGDTVLSDRRSRFVALKDYPEGKPGSSEDWRLFAPAIKGDDGQRGEKGERGLNGADGKDGVSIKSVTATEDGFIIEKSNGEFEVADLNLKDTLTKGILHYLERFDIPMTNFQGQWLSSKSYPRGTVVNYMHALWIAKVDTEEGVAPQENYANTTMMAKAFRDWQLFLKIPDTDLVNRLANMTMSQLPGPTEAYDFLGQQLKNLADPTNAGDAATKRYIDNKVINATNSLYVAEPGFGLQLVDAGNGFGLLPVMLGTELGTAPGVYGDAASTLKIHVNVFGQITKVETVPINISITQVNDYVPVDLTSADITGGDYNG